MINNSLANKSDNIFFHHIFFTKSLFFKYPTRIHDNSLLLFIISIRTTDRNINPFRVYGHKFDKIYGFILS